MTAVRLFLLAVLAAFAALGALPSRPALGASYVVDTTDDDSGITKAACTASPDDCSLRGAITNANASGPGDVITFDPLIFPSGAPVAVPISGYLPALSGGGDTIDGTGSGVIIDHTDEDRGFTCLVVSSAGNTIKGLQVTDCSAAIYLTTPASDANTIGPGNVLFDNTYGIGVAEPAATGNSIIGNMVGTNATGTALAFDGGNNIGVLVSGDSNTVGGSGAARNVVSGNFTGVYVSGSGNAIRGNFIGTDIGGTADLGNDDGVYLDMTASANTIGGLAPGQGNLISGNTNNNVRIVYGGSSNGVLGNIIGPDIAGSGAGMSNGQGISLGSGATGNVIGPRNVISDNTTGVVIGGAGTQGNVVKGNLIGTNLAGSAAIPNSQDGVRIETGATANTIGGTNPGDRNIIAFNGGDGVHVNGAGTTGNPVRGNSIHSNSGLEINNAGGGNLEIPPPIVASTVFGAVSGFACPNCAVDIFSDTSTDARFYEGSTTAGGDGSFAFANEAPFVGSSVTATSTDPAGNTSELAATLLIDSDADGTADGADADDDNDGVPDSGDPCRVFPEDHDGFQDSDGCPDPDNDLDGVCDPGLVSLSCANPAITTPPYPAGGATDRCPNVPEDYDAFLDQDGCPEPDNDGDSFPDPTDQCPATDASMGPDGLFQTADDAAFPDPREDFDGILDTDGCHDSPEDDFDGDSRGAVAKQAGACPTGGNAWPVFRDCIEAFMGTDPAVACARTTAPNDESPDPYPPDADDDGDVDIGDVLALFYGKLGSPANYTRRSDFDADNDIDIGDLLAAFFGRIGTSCPA